MYNPLEYWNNRLKNHGFVNSSKTQITDIEKEFVSKHLKQNMNVLDFGCGDGKLFDLFNEFECSGILYDIADFIQDKEIPKNFDYIVHPNIFELEFDSDEFETIFAISVLHHVQPHLIDELIKHLKWIGKDVIITSYENINKRNIALDQHCFNHNYLDICQRNGIKVKHYSNIDKFTMLWI